MVVRLIRLRFKHLHRTFFLSRSSGILDEQNVSILNDSFVSCAPNLGRLALCGEPPRLHPSRETLELTQDLR